MNGPRRRTLCATLTVTMEPGRLSGDQLVYTRTAAVSRELFFFMYVETDSGVAVRPLVIPRTAAYRAPSRTSDATLFFCQAARPSSTMEKTSTKKTGAARANSTSEVPSCCFQQLRPNDTIFFIRPRLVL